ncbi:MAG: type IV-A pilus assembly ATPase PilB [Gammaproteobacteria bacterium]|nr:type IV-A pilus assembly ATPase PilB [Gammaproteobacteria bacterium]
MSPMQQNPTSARDAAMALATGLRAPLLDLTAFDLAQAPRGLLDSAFLQDRRVLPLAVRAGQVFIATADPADSAAIEAVRLRTGRATRCVVVEPQPLAAALAALARSADAQGGGTVAPFTVSASAPDTASPPADGSKNAAGPTGSLRQGTPAPAADSADETPVVRFVQATLHDAIRAGASDIHFETYRGSSRVRFRVDGVLREESRPPLELGPRLASRLKVMAELDIAERRIPQDGRIRLTLGDGRSTDMRVNTMPTMWGEKIVLRILDASATQVSIHKLGFDPSQQRIFLDALALPQGMILVTGPTGSGKSVTLYAGLNVLNTEERNIATAEDPVEINVEGINQVQVNPKVGLDFATALRAFLRQDPDVVMVGEIRDLETAETAVQAAQTGHLLLATLHTNSAAETLTRLRNMGVPAFNLATSVSLIVAQRLARALCEACRKPQPVPAGTLADEGIDAADIARGARVFAANAEGCGNCRKGYRGRTGIYEVVRVTPAMSKLILNGGDSIELAAEARREGFPSLRSAGLAKVLAGITSLAEINRVTA